MVVSRHFLSCRDLSSAIRAHPLRNGVCPLPCGGSSPMNVGFSSFFFIPVNSTSPLFPFHVPPPISIVVSLLSVNKHAVVLSNLNLTFLTNHFELYGHGRRPPPEPPPPEDAEGLRLWVCGSFIFLVLYCFYVFCIVCLSLVYFKYALKVFDVRPQRSLDVKAIVLSKDLIVVVANKSLFFFTQQMEHSRVVSLPDFENPYSRSARPQAKEMIRNWIDLKIVVPQPTYHLWKKFAWVIGLSYLFGHALLVSIFSKLFDAQVLVGLIVCVVFQLWLGNVLTQCVSLCLYLIYLI
ncbi:unnamed protein product [Trifolium pratense]|uniref:Uncharacterized protein n=1 Tax=Trifolium pratense TaxID=57577 RepID=A0ACB0L2R5_TRIPR|nr:unnamed protein product [Trifolium pratense]